MKKYMFSIPPSVIEDGHADPGEIKMFEEETEKVWEFLTKMHEDPYSCSVGSCRNTDFSSGIPLSLDTDMGNTKLGKNVNNTIPDES